MKKRNHHYILGFVFIIMVLIATSDNVRGVFIPEFKNAFYSNNTQMGVLLTVSSIGYLTATLLGGILSERIGHKKVMLLGFLFAILSFISLYLSRSFNVLLIGMLFSNVGVSLLAIGINTLIPVIIISFQAVVMNLIHFCYGVGATITQRTAGILLYNGISWRRIYLFMAFVFTIFMIGFIFVKIPEPDQEMTDNKINHRILFKNKLLYLYMFALGLYVAAEMGTGNWYVNFMKDAYGFNDNKSTFYSALFFGIFTIGRLVGGFVVERFGHLKSVFISNIIAFLLLFIGIVMKENGVVVISIAGLFFGIAFPTMVITISRVFKKNSGYVTGIIITAASSISMGINFLMGWLNDTIGVYITYFTIPIALMLSAVFLFFILRHTQSIFEK